MFIDINKKDPYIFFFDSTGDPIPNEIKKLQDLIIAQGKSLDIDFKIENTTKIKHQKNDTECGIYCLYLLINLIEEKNITLKIECSDKIKMNLNYGLIG